MRILTDIRIEQLESGKQKTLNLLKGLAPDKQDQAAIYFPDAFFMDQGKPRNFHDVEQEYKFAVFAEAVKLFCLFGSLQSGLLLFIQFFWNNFVQPYDVHMGRQL